MNLNQMNVRLNQLKRSMSSNRSQSEKSLCDQNLAERILGQLVLTSFKELTADSLVNSDANSDNWIILPI